MFEFAKLSIYFFVVFNWLGLDYKYESKLHFLENLFNEELKTKSDQALSIQGERFFKMTKYPFLLYVSIRSFQSIRKSDKMLYNMAQWWLARCYCIQQRLLSHNSSVIRERLYAIYNFLEENPSSLSKSEKIEFYLEQCMANLNFNEEKRAKQNFEKAKSLLNAKISIKGELGKATKHQEKSIPQLKLVFERKDVLRKNSTNSKKIAGKSNTIKNVPLDDKDILEQIEFDSEKGIFDLDKIECDFVFCFSELLKVFPILFSKFKLL
ncbi:Tetratricopeptide repeat domain 27 [Bonamia ostreae]|uniref:Tetratricopeptide repeat domain 27 n=1 Tax=Bonamia ostreae TaxID=126728 RepID=A0ABV2AHP3_9EUKA